MRRACERLTLADQIATAADAFARNSANARRLHRHGTKRIMSESSYENLRSAQDEMVRWQASLDRLCKLWLAHGL